MSRTHRAPTQQSNSYKAHDSTILDYNQAFLNRQNKNFENRYNNQDCTLKHKANLRLCSYIFSKQNTE